MHNSWEFSQSWVQWGRPTCMPSRSTANYFPLHASTAAVLTQVLSHSATTFEEYSPTHLSIKNRASSSVPLESSHFNKSHLGFSRGFYYKQAKSCYYCICPSATSLPRKSPRLRHYRRTVQTWNTIEPTANSCFLLTHKKNRVHTNLMKCRACIK